MRRAEAGFSLLEMLVALAVFSLAVMALLHLSGQNARSAVIVEEQVLAGIVADTVAAESLLLDAAALANKAEGREIAGEREWHWQRRIVATPVAGLLRVDIEVHAPGEQRVVVAIQVFRGSP
jgi:general secretion pathway protein I